MKDIKVSHLSQKNKKIVIAGGSGFLGLNLAGFLAQKGFEVIIISRNPPQQSGPWKHLKWNGHSLGPWTESLNGASALVNLAGRSIDCTPTPEHLDEVLRSRLDATKVLGQAIQQIPSPPPVWVQMSTAHIYGDSLERTCDENSCLGYGFAPYVGREWERYFHEAALGTRKVILRTSFVLGKNGGALHRLSLLSKWGLGGRVGSGKQGIS